MDKERELMEEGTEQYDDDSIGAALDMAFNKVIQALNELKEIVKQL